MTPSGVYALNSIIATDTHTHTYIHSPAIREDIFCLFRIVLEFSQAGCQYCVAVQTNQHYTSQIMLVIPRKNCIFLRKDFKTVLKYSLSELLEYLILTWQLKC